MLMKSVSQERFDQNLTSHCENWGRVLAHVSVLRVATGKGLDRGGAIVTVWLAYGTSCEAEAVKLVHADASNSCVRVGNTLVPTPT